MVFMKKLLLILGILFTLVFAAGCGNQNKEVTQTQTGGQTDVTDTNTTDKSIEEHNDRDSETTESSEEDINADSQEEETDVSDILEMPGSKILVAYFSWSGNTEQMAQMIADDLNADLFQIVPVEAYTDDYDAVVDQAQQEQSEGARPEIAGDVENFDAYQTVFIGYPNWWSDVPMIINTFLERHDFTGKTVIPFCTSASSGLGDSGKLLEEMAGTGDWKEGMRFSSNASEEEVQDWVKSLNLN